MLLLIREFFELVDGEARNNVFLYFWAESGKQHSDIVPDFIPFLRTYAREGERKHLDYDRYEPVSVAQLANTQTLPFRLCEIFTLQQIF